VTKQIEVKKKEAAAEKEREKTEREQVEEERQKEANEANEAKKKGSREAEHGKGRGDKDKHGSTEEEMWKNVVGTPLCSKGPHGVSWSDPPGLSSRPVERVYPCLAVASVA
jgi:hypothetical protein